MTEARIINKNKYLFGPGPLARKPTGLAARPPLQGLVVCALQALAFSVVGGVGYNMLYGNPMMKTIDEYYKQNPAR
eukprot:CAMPEP_0176479470 /NCGR_PEP_ID=MMETSP0200_2-20121128/1760_1 /TAXON_ID=947934 /ORGANISM="Chaetoceros sp., Strain GSL56" /LENGTH=75 /DNA_ID=CAMNT_0017875523 /DNA_START=301 /DNA_END=528 /DNA_ORIENTATION=+